MELTDTYIEIIEALDCTDDERQDLCVALLESNLEFEEDQHHFRAFAISILHNDRVNGDWKERNRARLMEENNDLIRGLYGYNEDTADPMEELIARETIGERLDCLRPLLRETLEQHYIKGWTPEQIATFNHENVEAVRKRITRARNTLKGDNDG